MMKPLRTLLLLFVLLPGLQAVGGEAAGEADAAFAKLATEKRAAALKLSMKVGNNRVLNTFGVFISKDGLALVDLTALAKAQEPTVVTADGKELKFGTILKLFPEQQVALMKFGHQPEDFVPIAKKEPRIGEN